ncbi:MAG: hypothetical protein LDLANPLL_01360 [Turneriella sp.]|nr:hypothetical protein [Turneriella sp.]
MRKVATLFFFMAVVSLGAEIHPKYYREMQQNAPEDLRLKILDVSRDWRFWSDTRHVKVKAVVVEVNKSKVGLTPATQVFFEYDVFTPSGGWAGPRPMPLLEENSVTDFFGERIGVDKKRGVILRPTARGYSFERVGEYR